jgi:hypothetical protein
MPAGKLSTMKTGTSVGSKLTNSIGAGISVGIGVGPSGMVIGLAQALRAAITPAKQKARILFRVGITLVSSSCHPCCFLAAF